MLRVRDRENLSFQLWLEERQLEHVAQRTGDCSWQRGQWKKRHTVLQISCIWSMKYVIISRGAGSVWCTVQGGQIGREEQCKWSRCSRCRMVVNLQHMFLNPLLPFPPHSLNLSFKLFEVEWSSVSSSWVCFSVHYSTCFRRNDC